MRKILSLIFLIFFSAYVIKAGSNMATIPFHEFDEGHRAENAKKMKEYFSFLVPLTGSPVDRTENLKIPLRENPNLFLYYHPERPPFVYWLMIASTSIFGPFEWAYRLPSFLMTIATISVFLIFMYYSRSKVSYTAASVGTLSLITSADLWLSGQYAQLDTSFTFFLFLSLLLLIKYCEKKKNIFIVISGLSFSLAVLSKGQPAIIYIFPLVLLYFMKKITLRDILKFGASTAIILLPWFLLLEIYFGFAKILTIFTKFAASSAIFEYSHIKAPIFWYIRWWWDSFRPGWTLFLAFLALDFYSAGFKLQNLSWKKLTLLGYIFGGLVLFSLSVNKIWWYVLPLVPAVSFYVYTSAYDYLKINQAKLVNLSLSIVLISVPIFLTETNTVTLIYGILLTFLTFFILIKEIKLPKKISTSVFLTSLVFSLFVFFLNFPKIVPYHTNTKFVAEIYKGLPGKKCLYLLDIPPETALFYSNAGEIIPLTEKKELFPDCDNFLITPSDITKSKIIFYLKGKPYNLLNQEIIFQKDNMKLIKLQGS